MQESYKFAFDGSFTNRSCSELRFFRYFTYEQSFAKIPKYSFKKIDFLKKIKYRLQKVKIGAIIKENLPKKL